ncbi:hypothetical protein SAMN04488700_1605 [Carnobacterium iners]|uniref:KAP family P-loop domain-containing protein n=1 Tax=Carnobacterium iners TaxID=1073423 RepID=A0A1X7N908_9LACT|nr:hypothetical protein [Carnobacterium iners]SEL07809.1 hypothetical protein SAMN04488114_12412 [Carnobacterium iners]SMH33995.1 hypothetical protein SAMN04488700_1605 [Carnobacterium iners]
MNKINWMAARTEVTLTAKEYSYKKSNYLFHISIERILELCDQYKINAKDSNRSISIVGERGSGKTSVVKTVSQILKAKDYFVFDIVDPGVFSGTISLLELLISNIYLYINKNSKANNYSNLFGHSNSREILEFKMIEEIEGIMDTLANFRIDKSVFSNENTSMEVLNDINNRVSFNKNLSKLINDLKVYTGKENIVLCIDDLDLVDNKDTYNMLEDIRKYLLKDITVIVSYRDVQLLDAVVQKNLNENKELKNEGFIDSNDIYNQSTKYIEKLLPLSSRVYLQKTNEVWSQKNSDVLYALLNFEKLNSEKLNYEKEFVEKYAEDEKTMNFLKGATVKEWLIFAIFKKTRINITPVDAKEEMIVGLPDNMRGLLQLIEIVHERLVMPKNNDEKYLEIIRNNLKIYKEYYYDFISEKLPTDEMKIIKKWEGSPVESKNYNIYQALFHEIKKSVVSANKEMKSFGNMDQLLNINLVSNENVTIGDVYEILERYKMTNADDPEAVFFVYVIKVIYSIELLRLYINGNIKKENSIDSYLNLLNNKITPDGLIYVEESDNIIKYNKQFIEKINLNMDEFSNRSILILDTLIKKLMYTTFTAKGNNSQNIRFKLNNTKEAENKSNGNFIQTKNITYAYRSYYSKNIKEITLSKNYSYYFDLLTYLTKRNYIEDSFEDKNYIYYSMFDMDKLLRVNFGGANPNYTLYSVIDQIKNLFVFSNTEKGFTYLYENFENKENKNIFREYTKEEWNSLDLLLKNRQELVENFEEIKRADVENNEKLFKKYKELESDLYSINKHTESQSLAIEITNFKKNITSNIVLIPTSKKGLRDAIKDVLKKENDKLNKTELNELNNMVIRAKLRGPLNKQDREQFINILDAKNIRYELK